MVCTDRQLAQSAREQGFSTRAGVVRAVRPFSGEPTGENLVDYLNREIFPTIKGMRERVNEAYPQVAEQAPSANNLQYAFSASTVAADPTAGFLRLDQAVQNTATVVRVSELNQRLVNTSAFLSIMQGSGTSPLGVLTLQHLHDPNRFIRFNLTSATDQGTYWDLGVTAVESSHPNPFTENDPGITIGFIAGVASGGVSPATSIPAIRAVSAGTQLQTSGTLSFANNGFVTFGLSNSSVLTASHGALRIISAGTTNVVNPTAGLSFSNGSGVSWGLDGSTLTASVVQLAASASVYGGSISAGTLVFSNDTVYTAFSSGVVSQNVLFSLDGSTMKATALVGFGDAGGPFVGSRLDFLNSNGVTVGLGTLAAPSGRVVNATLSVDPRIGLVSHIGGNSVGSVTRLAFSNASNVTFSLSTAASAATLLASVVAQTFIGAIAAGTQTATSGTIIFSNSNGVSFGLSGSTRVTASVNPEIGLVSHVGGNSAASVTRLAFSNASNVTFSLSTAANAATLLASVAAGGGGGIALAASGSTQTDGTVEFVRATVLDGGMASASVNNVAFSFNTGASSNHIQATALMRVTANLTTSGGFPVSKINFVNSNGVTFGVATSNDAEGRAVNVTASVEAAGAVPDLSYLKNWNEATGLVNAAQVTASCVIFPINDMNILPGNMTLNTMDLWLGCPSFTSTQSTGSFGWTLRAGLYSLNNSTQLTRINSFSTAFSTTTQSFSARNPLFSGARRITVHSSQWSAQPVVSANQLYWLAVNWSSAGVNVGSRFLAYRPATRMDGDWGATSTRNRNMMPFLGYMNTTSPPVSIGTASVTQQGAPTDAWAVQFRNGIGLTV